MDQISPPQRFCLLVAGQGNRTDKLDGQDSMSQQGTSHVFTDDYSFPPPRRQSRAAGGRRSFQPTEVPDGTPFAALYNLCINTLDVIKTRAVKNAEDIIRH